MPVKFGLGLVAGPKKNKPLSSFIDDLDMALPYLGDQFTSLWMTDHLFWDDDPTYEAWTTLAYLAARYPTMQIGPMVLGQSYRNPALLAKMAATLQALSSGRFIMGIGAGWKEDEYLAYGYDYPTPGVRLEQLEDTLEIFTRLWHEPGQVTYEGKHYHVKNAWSEPKPDPMIPILVGGKGNKTIHLAARFAQLWNMPDAALPAYQERLAILEQACEEVGRDPATIRRTWFGRIGVGRTETEAVARGGRWHHGNAFIGTPARIVDEMNAFVRAGCDFFMVDILGLPDPDVLELVSRDIVPHIG